MSDYQKVQFATEVAFNSLLDEAKKLGLPLEPVMGLMYLPTSKLTSDFQTACRAILDALKTPQEN
jgi:hypothetical protein